VERWLRAHNDDARVPVLINPTVFSTISNIRFSGTPFDCCFIPLFFLQTLKRNCVSSSRRAVGKWETRSVFQAQRSFPPLV